MSSGDAFVSFVSLPSALTATEFKAISVSGARKDFLAKNADGAPVFLLHDASPAKYNPSINYRHLSAQFHVTCRVEIDGLVVSDQFCIVSCEAASADLHELFVRSVGAAIEGLPKDSSTREIEACISTLRELFQSLAVPSSREVAGLWAELFVIYKSGNIERALEYWHSDQYDRFDFSHSAMRLEVKSTVRNVRAHEFALEQLEAPDNGVGVIVSVLLQRLNGGIGVLDLAQGIEDEVSGIPRLRLKLWQNVALVLGQEFSVKLDMRVDAAFAEKHMIVYAMGDIPRPSAPTDPRITAIRFVAELSTVSTSFKNAPLSSLALVLQ